MKRVDDIITRDLAALGENSRRDVPAIDAALRTTDAYRDGRPGAEARRDALAEERKRELVLMPLTLAHVFAHRVGRIAAGSMAALVAAALVGTTSDQLLMRTAMWILPGLNVGTIVLLACVSILGSYVIATWIAEAWFARRMRSAIKTGTDAYEDLDHLARGPLEIAHHAVQKVDAWSTAAFLMGVTWITLAFGYVITIVGLNHTLEHAWSMYDGEYGRVVESLSTNAGYLGVALVITTVAAIAIGRACMREARGSSQLLRAIGAWSSLVIAGVVGIVTLYNGFHVAAEFRHRLPTDTMRFALTIGATISVFLPAAWILLAWRRREQARIG